MSIKRANVYGSVFFYFKQTKAGPMLRNTKWKQLFHLKRDVSCGSMVSMGKWTLGDIFTFLLQCHLLLFNLDQDK